MKPSPTPIYLSTYTVELYREKFGMYHPVGSGLLIKNRGKHLLISAYHVIDMEDERIGIENDPDEIGIPQDDMESIMAKGKDDFFVVNEKVTGLVWTAQYDEETKNPIFSDDVEWCICELSDEMIQNFLDIGKNFYEIKGIPSLTIDSGSEIIIAGYPGYAQKDDQEIFRSYKGALMNDFHINNTGLFRVRLDRTRAYCQELKSEVEIPKINGIGGMSGGGLWYKTIDNNVPLGIVITQDSNNNYVEGFSINGILNFNAQENI